MAFMSVLYPRVPRRCLARAFGGGMGFSEGVLRKGRVEGAQKADTHACSASKNSLSRGPYWKTGCCSTPPVCTSALLSSLGMQEGE